MRLCGRKTMAVAKLKFKMVLSNTSAMMGPIMAIGMVAIMKILYGSLAGDSPEQLPALYASALNMGVVMNISLGGLMLTCLPMAEEKEKNTLRSLMTSSVNGLEYFLGSIVSPMIVMIVTNVLAVLISGIDMSQFNWGMYLLLTTIASLLSCVLGMLIAIFSKSQMSANASLTPFGLILAIVPMFGLASEGLGNASKFLYTGVVSQMLSSYGTGTSFTLETQSLLVFIVQGILIMGLFVFFYQRNGYEAD